MCPKIITILQQDIISIWLLYDTANSTEKLYIKYDHLWLSGSGSSVT